MANVERIKTLGLRMRQHETNAMRVANFQRVIQKLQKLCIQGFLNLRLRASKRQMNGFGAMISLKFKGFRVAKGSK